MNAMKCNICRAVFAAALLALPSIAVAQDSASTISAGYPNKPIRITLPFPAAGPADIMTRTFAEKLRVDLGEAVVVLNRPGADSIIGTEAFTRSAPDGYNLLVASDVTMVMNSLTHPDLRYKPLEDFVPITLMSLNSLILLVPSSGPKTVQELITQAKAQPGALNYGAGIITTRLASLLFSKLAGIETVFIPYKGSADVVQALLGGDIQFAVDGIATGYPMIEAGKLRALAKLNNRPTPSLPELKLLSEAAGLAQLGEISTWAGIFAPRDTPAEITEKIAASIKKAARDPDLTEKLSKLGIGVTTSAPAELSTFIRAEQSKWSGVIRSGGIVLE